MKLYPHTAVLWNEPGCVQIGGDLSHRLVIEDLTPQEQQWLRSQAQPSPARSPEISARLREKIERAHLSDAPRPRPRLTIACEGLSPAPMGALRALCDALSLSVFIPPCGYADQDWARFFARDDMGVAKDRCARRLLSDLLPAHALHDCSPADFVLVCADRVVDPGVSMSLINSDTPHLLVVRGEHGYEIGPLVIPGITPCQHCVESSRIAQDPYRLGHLAQLSSFPLGTLPLLAHQLAATHIASLVAAFARAEHDLSRFSQVTTIRECGRIDSVQVYGQRGCICGIDGIAV